MGQGDTAKVHVIIGPTSSGKSARALELARTMDGVIINFDALQIYDALPILTAQPNAEDCKSAPHRLYSALHPADTCSAGRWRDMAITEIEIVFENGQTPILVGGTGFYLKALTEGLSPIPDIPDDIRQEAVETHEKIGTAAMADRLSAIDPFTAQNIDLQNSKRVIRAWEVFKATGTPLAELQSLPKDGPPSHWQFEMTKILPERIALIERINARFETMMARNVLDEVNELSERIDNGEIPENAQITIAHGFKALRRYLRGEWSLDKAADYTKTETRQYAKRQMTWIRNQL